MMRSKLLPLIDGMGPLFYPHLRSYGEIGPISRCAEFLYLFIGSRFLPAKIVAGETNGHYPIFELLAEFLQLLIRWRITAL